MMERRYGVEPLDPFSYINIVTQEKEKQLLLDYYWCRAHHRQMWSTIARLDDATILRCDFRISAIKEAVAYYLGFDATCIYRHSMCYACLWTNGLGRGCYACPIYRNLGENCNHNAYGLLRRLSGAYSSLECSERTIYWKGYLERFRSLALEMANAW